MTTEIQVFLVVPCFHESGRISAFIHDLVETFDDTDPVRILLVEDGSGEDEQKRFLQVVTPLIEGRALFAPPLLLPENLGKGGAVYAGWARHSGQAWLAFADADGSCSAREINRLMEIALGGTHRTTFDLEAASQKEIASRVTETMTGSSASFAHAVVSPLPPRVAYFASRIKMLGYRIDRRLKRHIIGRLYATLVSELHGIDVYDSQCGLKIIPRDVWETLRPCLEQRGFAFDVELLTALTDAGVEIREIPINWHEVPGGKVRLVRDSLRMLREVLAIKRKRSTPVWRRTMGKLHQGRLGGGA
ncbi:MAG: glycosyltransferase [Prosthecobacter sp.]|nr:glycosyltransferase [Prosthecobacter sp.]